MNARTLIAMFLMTFFTMRAGFAQGGPYLVDYLYPSAWPNPVSTVLPGWLDTDIPSTVLSGQTLYVKNTTILAQKQKDYYYFQDSDKENGIVHKNLVDNDSCRVWLEWNGYFYPSNGGYDCQYDALPLSQLDPKCFTSLSGPYCNLPIGVTYVGQVGNTWVAVSGLARRMGGEFTAAQIDKILYENAFRNEEVLRSDLREELVAGFLAQFPEINTNDIPIDYQGDSLTDEPGHPNTAVVCHIVPALAPEGYGAGRNAYSNAMVVSSNMKKILTDAFNGTGEMPSDAMLMYFEYLGSLYGAKSSVAAESRFSVSYIRDWKSMDSAEVEMLTEDETRIAMQHAGLIRPTSIKPARK